MHNHGAEKETEARQHQQRQQERREAGWGGTILACVG